YLNPISGLYDNSATATNFPLSATVTPAVLPNYTWSQTGVLLAGYFPDNQYNVESQATDAAGNVEMTWSTITFIVDSTPPSTTITQPLTGSAYSVVQPLTNITGSSNDPGSFPSGVAQVQLSVAQISGGTTHYFDGSLFTPTTEYMLTATSTAPWSYWATGLN